MTHPSIHLKGHSFGAGLHALELCKLAWNATCVGPSLPRESKNHIYEAEFLELSRAYLDIARTIIRNYGREGDDGGPLAEIETMEDILGNA
jgi:hypothetical protein